MANVTVEINDRPVIDALNQLRAAGSDLRPAMAAIGNVLLTNVQMGFRTGTDPYGRPWKPVLRGGQPLVDTGRLRSSFTYHADADSVMVGTNVRYAATQQFGATIRAKHHPYLRFRIGDRWARKKQVTIDPRPFLPTDGLPESWREDVLDVLSRHFQADGSHAG